MTAGVLIQVLFDLIILAAVAFFWVKISRPQKDDPRLSRGLQLLQSKIAVLEDLSDQIETQVQQITALMEAKAREVQSQIAAADKQIQKIDASMGKSLEVARIFQDRIPHQEIIERKNTLKYVKAARLAHQGVSIEEIAAQVDLTRGEVEMIAKVNREQLQFSEEDLPEWAKEEIGLVEPAVNSSDEEEILEAQPLTRAEDKVEVSLSALGQKIRQALPTEAPIVSAASASQPQIEMPAKAAASAAATVLATNKPVAVATKEKAQTTTGKSVEIQKVVFPRLDMTQHLS